MITPEHTRGRRPPLLQDRATLPTPYLALDVPAAARRYDLLSPAFGDGRVHHAVRADPHPALLTTLARRAARVDVLDERDPVALPLTLREGDLVRFSSAGASTTCHSTVGLNGFAPLPTVLV